MRRQTCLLALWSAFALSSVARAETFEVGVDKPLQSLGAVPWEALKAGDVVRIHHRAEPYREKFVLAVSGTLDSPIRIEGVPGPNGERPVIDGENATTRAQLDFWNDVRGVIKIGGASKPNAELGAHIVLQGLTIRGGRQTHKFSSASGVSKSYEANAAAVFIERGENITVRDCGLYDSGNGLFVANKSRNISVYQNDIAGNGNPSSDQEHNVYSEALNIWFEGNSLGALCGNCLGNNLKDRSAGTIVRYNWIEGGNRQLDLVETSDDSLRNVPAYAYTLVYGNVLIERDDNNNRQIVHWGGDGTDKSRYRTGNLYFYANTIISRRSGRTSLLRNSSPTGTAQIYGNIVHCTAGANQLEILADALGTAVLRKNWLTQSYVPSFMSGATIDVDGSNLSGLDPKFVSQSDYRLAADSPCLNKGGFPAVELAFMPTLQAPTPRALEGRPEDALPDIGALERGIPTLVDAGAPLSDGGAGDVDASTGNAGNNDAGSKDDPPRGGALPAGSSSGDPQAADGGDEGCSCRVAGDRSSPWSLGALALFSWWLVRRRAAWAPRKRG